MVNGKSEATHTHKEEERKKEKDAHVLENISAGDFGSVRPPRSFLTFQYVPGKKPAFNA